jgi:hypothetical protein
MIGFQLVFLFKIQILNKKDKPIGFSNLPLSFSDLSFDFSSLSFDFFVFNFFKKIYKKIEPTDFWWTDKTDPNQICLFLSIRNLQLATKLPLDYLQHRSLANVKIELRSAVGPTNVGCDRCAASSSMSGRRCGAACSFPWSAMLLPTLVLAPPPSLMPSSVLPSSLAPDPLHGDSVLRSAAMELHLPHWAMSSSATPSSPMPPSSSIFPWAAIELHLHRTTFIFPIKLHLP